MKQAIFKSLVKNRPSKSISDFTRRWSDLEISEIFDLQVRQWKMLITLQSVCMFFHLTHARALTSTPPSMQGGGGVLITSSSPIKGMRHVMHCQIAREKLLHIFLALLAFRIALRTCRIAGSLALHLGSANGSASRMLKSRLFLSGCIALFSPAACFFFGMSTLAS